MLNPDLVGCTFTGATSTKITQEAITAFAHALGEENISVAPPTFGITVTLAQSQTVLKDSGLDWTRVVHGDQRFEIHTPIVAGMSLTCDCTIESARVVAGNEIVSVKADLLSDAKLIASTWATLVFRG
jgi:hypothetical protein